MENKNPKYIRVIQCNTQDQANWYLACLSMAGYNVFLNPIVTEQKIDVCVTNSTNGQITFEIILDELKSLGYNDAELVF